MSSMSAPWRQQRALPCSTNRSPAAAPSSFIVQGNLYHAATGGISLFTYGKASGLHLHAASGKFSSQSQAAKTTLTADKAITVASVNAQVDIVAKQHVLLTTQGAAIRLEGGDITLSGPGRIEFKGAKKNLTGPQGTKPLLPVLPQANVMEAPTHFSNRIDMSGQFDEDELESGVAYKIKKDDGSVITGMLDPHGRTARIFGTKPAKITALAGDGEWIVDIADLRGGCCPHHEHNNEDNHEVS